MPSRGFSRDRREPDHIRPARVRRIVSDAGGDAVAPPERSSDADVLNYIRKYSDAIDYVRAGVPLGPAIKAISVLP